jgi:hypothetical protein
MGISLSLSILLCFIFTIFYLHHLKQILYLNIFWSHLSPPPSPRSSPSTSTHSTLHSVSKAQYNNRISAQTKKKYPPNVPLNYNQIKHTEKKPVEHLLRWATLPEHESCREVVDVPSVTIYGFFCLLASISDSSIVNVYSSGKGIHSFMFLKIWQNKT